MTLTRTTIARAPVHVDVGAASIMILPPRINTVTLTAEAWDGTETYAQGAFVRSTDPATGTTHFYWAVIGGASGDVQPVHTDGDAADGAITWRIIRAERRVLSLTNISANNIFISRGEAAELNKGLALEPSGSVNEGFAGPEPYDGAWYAIATGATSRLCISEG